MPPLDSTATLHGTPYAHPVETSTNLRSIGTFSNRPQLLFHTYTRGLERMGTLLQLPQASYLAPGTVQLTQASYITLLVSVRSEAGRNSWLQSSLEGFY
jgi:hypothetical protein